MKKSYAFYAISLLIAHIAAAQEAPPLSDNTHRYIEIGAGLNISRFTDFATSPRVYRGAGLQFSVNFKKTALNSERDFSLRYAFGNNTTSINNEDAESAIKIIFLRYQKLYTIQGWSGNKWNIKAGWVLDGTANVRVNERLQNNAIGIDMFYTGSAAFKVTRDVSREQPREKKRLIGKTKTLEPRKRLLSAQLNAAVIPTTFRNGYAYSNNSGVTEDPSIFHDYEFNFFSGYRVSSAISYTLFRPNGNAVSFSYLWDAYKTGGDLDVFQMSHHTLQISLWYNTK